MSCTVKDFNNAPSAANQTWSGSLVYLGLGSLPLVAWAAWKLWDFVMPRPDETFTFGFDGAQCNRPVKVDAFFPQRSSATKAPLPAVILVHGVEGAARYARNYYLIARELAKAGHAVYYVHYFDAVDYEDIWVFRENGQLDIDAVEEFCQADKECWIAAVSEAIRVVGARPEVDAQRIALFGYSLGCFVSLSAAQASILKEDIPPVAAVVGHWGAKFREATFSPGFPPTRLFHGANDSVVLLDWARQTLVALRAVGADAALMEIPGQGHMASSRHAWRETLAFLRQMIVPQAKPEVQPLMPRLRTACAV